MLRIMKHQGLGLSGQGTICPGDENIKKPWPSFVEMEILAKVLLLRNGWVNGIKDGKPPLATSPK